MKTAWLWVSTAAAWLAGPFCACGCSPDLYEETLQRSYVCDISPTSGGGFLVLSYEGMEAAYKGTCVDRIKCDFSYSVFGLARFDENGLQLWKTTIKEDVLKIDGHKVMCGRVDYINGRIVVTGWFSRDWTENHLWIVGLDEDGERLWGRVEEDSDPGFGFRSEYGYPSEAPWKTVVTQCQGALATVSGFAMEDEHVMGLYTLDLYDSGEIRDRRMTGMEGWPWDEDIYVEDLEPVRDGGHVILVSYRYQHDDVDHCAAARIDDTGSIVWIRYLYPRNGFDGDPVGIRQTVDGSFVLTLKTRGQSTLVWLDHAGRVTETSSWEQENLDLEPTRDGSILLAGGSPGPPAYDYRRVSLISAGRGGLDSWEKRFDLYLGAHEYCPDTLDILFVPGGGSMLVVNGGPILRLGPDGETLWSIDRSSGCD